MKYEGYSWLVIERVSCELDGGRSRREFRRRAWCVCVRGRRKERVYVVVRVWRRVEMVKKVYMWGLTAEGRDGGVACFVWSVEGVNNGRRRKELSGVLSFFNRNEEIGFCENRKMKRKKKGSHGFFFPFVSSAPPIPLFRFF